MTPDRDDPDGQARTGCWARLTLIHEGSGDSERYRLDSWRPVAGERPWLPTPDDRGAYRWVLQSVPAQGDAAVLPGDRPPATADPCLASLGFSPLFGEWQSTLEATDHRVQGFLECIYCPLPSQPSQLLVQRRTPAGTYETLIAVPLAPMPDPLGVPATDPIGGPLGAKGPAARTAAAIADGIEITAIGDTGPARSRINLLLIGDGYTPDEGECFLADAARFEASLFAVEPYRRRRADFNVHALFPPAKASGVADPRADRDPESPLGAAYGSLGIDRYLLPRRLDRLYALCDLAPCDLAVVLCNADKFGGGGLFDQYCCVAAHARDFAYLARHEFGHAFAGLADEYYTAMVTYRQGEDAVVYWEPNVSCLSPAGGVKWSHLIPPDVPVPTPWRKGDYEDLMRRHEALRAAAGGREAAPGATDQDATAPMEPLRAAAARLLREERYAGRVGAFEGAAYRSQGVYRPEVDCLMFSRSSERFCRVCEAAIEATIDRYLALRRGRGGAEGGLF